MPRALRALAHPAFRLIWTSFVVGQAGFWLSYVCIQLMVVTIAKGDAWSQSVLVFCLFIPQIVFGPIAGVLADRLDRRRTMMTVQAAFGGIAGVLAVGTALGLASLWALDGVAVTLGGAMAFLGPTGLALTGQSVPRESLPSAVALQQVAQQLARMAGPALAVPVVLIGGPVAAFAGFSLAALLTVFVLSRVRVASFAAAGRRMSLREQFAGGWRHAAERPPALVLLSMVAVAAAVVGPYPSVLAPIIAVQVLHQAAGGFFAVVVSVGAGAAVGALATGFMEGRPRLRVALGLMGVLGIGTALIGLAPGYVALLLASALYGGLFFALMSTAGSVIQQLVEERSRGRVMSLYALAWGGVLPFGGLAMGGLALKWGPQAALVVSGVVTTAYAGAVALVIAARRRRAAARPEAAPEPE